MSELLHHLGYSLEKGISFGWMTAALSGKLLADWEESCNWRDKIILFGVTFFCVTLWRNVEHLLIFIITA